VILDPFVGTGSTSLAAMSSGRSSIGLEVDSRYIRLAKERLERALLIRPEPHLFDVKVEFNRNK